MSTAYEYYEKALKKGKKESKAAASRGQSPYLTILDDVKKEYSCRQEVSLGLKEIPLEQVAGTATAGRASSFAPNFMPLLEKSTEFGNKWISLCNAHLNEGISDPIRVIEFLHRFYVVEGNKRVSVMKFFGAVKIPAHVYRLSPEFRVDKPELRLYNEFLQFYRLTGLYEIELSKEGSYYALASETGYSLKEAWSEEQVAELARLYTRFVQEEKEQEIKIPTGDGLLKLIQIYGYRTLADSSLLDFKRLVKTAREELKLLRGTVEPAIVLDPVTPKKTSVAEDLVNLIVDPDPSIKTIGFVSEKDVEHSAWTYAHDIGRAHVADTFPDIKVNSYFWALADYTGDAAIQQAIDDKCDVIFTTSPRLLEASVRKAVENPKVRILNCSLNTSYKTIRTYYSRMYEAKFLVGAVAGALCKDEYIGYVADYPLFGMISNINAFALGVQLTNPNAKIKLVWSKTENQEERWQGLDGIHFVSGQEMFTPHSHDRSFGLYYKDDEGNITNIVDPTWNWGEYYVRMIQNLKKGSWKQDVDPERKALNYWWGMSAGVIDLAVSDRLPVGTAKLLKTLRQSLESGELLVFSGDIYAQGNRVVKHDWEGSIPVEEIMTMDWLLNNVEGRIPKLSELQEEAKEVTKVAGVMEAKHEDSTGF